MSLLSWDRQEKLCCQMWDSNPRLGRMLANFEEKTNHVRASNIQPIAAVDSSPLANISNIWPITTQKCWSSEGDYRGRVSNSVYVRLADGGVASKAAANLTAAGSEIKADFFGQDCLYCSLIGPSPTVGGSLNYRWSSYNRISCPVWVICFIPSSLKLPISTNFLQTSWGGCSVGQTRTK